MTIGEKIVNVSAKEMAFKHANIQGLAALVSFHNLEELRLQGCTTDQKAIDIWLAAQLLAALCQCQGRNFREENWEKNPPLVVTDPPYKMRTSAATDGDTLEATQARTCSWTSWACSGVATFPVPIAQTGS